MQQRDVVDRRFEIMRLAGSGGMGHVFQAIDRQRGKPVALKVMQGTSGLEHGRFDREAQALAATQLPGVVRYIAHGTTREGRPYLAMEWLEGETLAERLARKALTLGESLALAARVATTLGAVHRRGIVHRDLKPSNLMLVNGDIEQVTIIDFGVVRMFGVEQQLNTPGAIVGTPGYMAPEQARGQLHIDARVDVFAIGCVLFKCLTGRTAFEGVGALAVLAKVIFEDPPRVRELRADVPRNLDALVTRMLSKSPDGRPRDGDALAAELAALDPAPCSSAMDLGLPLSTRPQEITTDERKVMCLVLAMDALSEPDATISDLREQERARGLHAIAERYHGKLELIEARLPLVVLSGAIAPTDLAVKAARCALAMQRMLEGPPVAIVTGRAELAARLPVGELIDRAVQMVPARRDPDPATAIRLDEVTAALLGGRFDTAQDSAGWWLRGARREIETPPQLLGKPTPCLGREQELAQLAGELSRCVGEPAATAVLVTGAAGMGKSRLCHEFLRTLRNRSDGVEVWVGQADPMSAGSAFGLLAHALRRGLGLVDGEPLDERRRKVRARVAQHGGLDAARVAAFLGELVGAPFPDDDDVQLRAARQSPMLMGDQLRLAWEEFLAAECATQPVVLVLEDLHWGDLPTVTMLDGALRKLRSLPLMVLALARPDVHEVFPGLWEGRGGQEVRLMPMSRRASEELVRQVLGDAVSPELLERLVQRADGNAFYLEEQLRAAASGKTQELPETVLAMVQMEIEALDAEARRVLRAAGVFGEKFTQGGVAALVGVRGAEVAAKLAELAGLEVIQRVATGGSGEVEYRFRHALLREAAYGMLTERDRQTGHALAGDWLELSGNADPMALAEHFERGGEPARAATAYLRAAEHALRGNDFAAVIERAERGIACGGEPETIGALRLVQADARRWRGEYALAEQGAIEAIALLTPGAVAWFSAVAQAVGVAGKLGGLDRVAEWMTTARDVAAVEGAEVARQICLATGATELSLGGRYAAADALIESVEGAAPEASSRDVQVVAKLSRARSIRAQSSGDPSAALEHQEAAVAALEQIGDRRNACMARGNIAYFNGQLGDYEAAEEALRAALVTAERMQLPSVVATALQNLGRVLAYRGKIEEARSVEEASLAAFQRLNNPRMEGGSRLYLAGILVLAGEHEAAEGEARAAVEVMQLVPAALADAHAVHARALLGLGRTGEALEAARKAFAVLSSVGSEEGESLVRLVHAEALAASGDGAGAEAAIASARESLLGRAARIGDAAWRERFLRNVPDNARTLELAVTEGGLLQTIAG